MAELTQEGKPLPKLLFIDIMLEKTQMLINHIKHLQLGLSLVANISENVATIKLYNNYAVNSLLLHVTISTCGMLRTNYTDCGLRSMIS